MVQLFVVCRKLKIKIGGPFFMKHIKKISAAIIAMALIFTMAIIPTFAGDVMEFATGCVIKFNPPVAGQSVAEVNKTIKLETESFVITDVYWVPDGILPTILPSGETVGNINMGSNGLEMDGKVVAVMNDKDVFKENSTYLLILGITNKEKIMDQSSQIKINGADMVYEGYGDKDHTGKILLFAQMYNATNKDAPQAVFIATGSDSGNLENVTNKTQYSVDGQTWNDCTGSPTRLTGLTAGTIDVRYSDSPTNVQTIVITQNDVPKGVGSTNCTTTANNDGTLTGLSKTSEYRIATATGYSKPTSSTVTSLGPGTYYVRTEANGTALASGDVQVVIAEHKASVPSITKQPVDATIDTGSTATFKVEASGEDLKYEWHYIDYNKKTEKIIETDNVYFSGQGTNTITVKSVNEMKTNEVDCEYSGDQFYCVISNSSGTIKSNIVTYKVNHVAGKEWKSDSTSHWQLCVCGKMLNKATHVDADKDGKCDVCKYDLSSSKTYKLVYGQGSVWTKGSIEYLSFICDGKKDNLKSVLVDDKEIKDSNYSITTDPDTNNLVISLSPEYLETLTPKSHTVSIKFSDGKVSGQFTIDDQSQKDDPVPQKQPVIGWVILGIAILAVIAIVVLVILLVKNNKKSKGQR